LSEGYGRFFYKENRQFCHYGRGALFETRTWLTKARSRGLVREEDDKKLRSDLDTLGRRLNAYIKSIGGSQGKVKESGPEWDIDSRDTMTNDASAASK
jgi:hypothetical protein